MGVVRTDARGMLRALAKLEMGMEPVFLDTETTGFNPRRDKLVTVQLLVEGHKALVLDVRHLSPEEKARLGEALQTTLDGRTVVGHNLKFDLGFLRAQLGVRVRECYDTMLAEMLIEGVGGAEGRGAGIRFDLAGVYAKYTKETMSKAERDFFPGLDTRPEWDEPLPAEQVRYMALDVEALVPIRAAQATALFAGGLKRVAKLEMAVVPALVEVEDAGIRVDVDGWRAFIAEKDAEARELEAKALEHFAQPILQARIAEYDEAQDKLVLWEARLRSEVERLHDGYEHDAGEKWGTYKQRKVAEWKSANPRPPTPKQDMSLPNLGSSTQLLDGFRQLGVSLESTGTMALADVQHPAAAALLAWRKAVKFGQSFGDGLLAKIEEDGRIHPDYQQIGASTGRMSCRNPNWQQIPSRGDGARMRALVVPEPGNVLVVADFSNIELRILASMSGDKNLVRMFSEGLDLHEETARLMFGLGAGMDPKTATLGKTGITYRTIAKTLNYGLVYGMSAVRLGRVLRIERERAEHLMQDYFRQFPGVTAWLEARKATALAGDEPEARTASGRRRRFPGMDQAMLRQYRRLLGQVQRQLANTPIQGTSADITKAAVAAFHGSCPTGARLVAVVHDELVVECPEAMGKRVARRLTKVMDEAQRDYIERKEVRGRTEAVISGYWCH